MKNEDKIRTCCFFGHRNIKETCELENKLYTVIEELIVNKGVTAFLFGSRSQFDSFCLKTVTRLKERFSHIKRIYVRAEYPYIDDTYLQYLLTKYEYTYYPERIINSGKAVYIERNYEMIDRSNYCIVYYDEKYSPAIRKKGKNTLSSYQPKSGTKSAYEYAIKKDREIINIFSV